MPVEHLEVPAGDGTADAYRAGNGPAVLLAMDAFGLRPQIAEMVERIAAEGYTVLAPNLLYRGGRTPVVELPDLSDPDARSGFFDAIRPHMAQLDGAASAADARAYLDYLDGPVVVAGYCMGARFAFRMAAEGGERVVGMAGFHAGGLVTDADDSPHLRAGDVRAEVVLGHAKDDGSMPPEAIAAFDTALDEAGVRHSTAVYDADHGFTMADTAAYDEAAAERSHRELVALLQRTL